MKKPKLNKVGESTLYRSCEDIQRYLNAGALQDFNSEAQRLIDCFIPEGWCLDFDDIDKDGFDSKTNHIYTTFKAVDELNCCYASCNSLRVTQMIKRIVVRQFTSWLSEQFRQFGKELTT